ncbi:hypothetical protein XENTR_v10021123 [Xenopus tropicalis]|nr:hypothetical protein XENTR_v10021123 [Xenopus tropicalis]
MLQKIILFVVSTNAGTMVEKCSVNIVIIIFTFTERTSACFNLLKVHFTAVKQFPFVYLSVLNAIVEICKRG